uniref:Uncharacterized protein n=1 Tax=Arundo donax TaxID=35708 RepID=A0A0A8ZNT9_ARUDO
MINCYKINIILKDM